MNGQLYPTTEHAYQCQRYTDEKIVKEIICQPSPVLAWQASCKYKHLQISEFKDPDHKLKVMKNIMRLKAEQHADVRQALIDSENQEIVKHIVTGPPGDGFWDDGEDGKGENRMGKMWMEIREEIKNSQ